MYLTNTKMNFLKRGFDHPCRETCSGWKQGYDRAVYDHKKKLEKIAAMCGNPNAFDACRNILKEISEADVFVCPHEDCGKCFLNLTGKNNAPDNK